MYGTRVIRVPSSGHRVAKATPPFCRNMSSGFWPGPSIHRGSSFGNSPVEFAPFFRMLDDYASTTSRALDNFLTSSPTTSRHAAASRIWQPRFDVREIEDAYELRGELPGVESQDLNVEFTDANTLIIRGSLESGTTSGVPPSQRQDNEQSTVDTDFQTTPADTSDAASVHSDNSTSSYVKPSVEDEAEADARTTTTSATAGEDKAPSVETTVTAQADQPIQRTEQSESRYWVSERRTGSFQRTFSFPGRINQEGVTASLKNGILDIVVPKQAAPEARRINVQ